MMSIDTGSAVSSKGTATVPRPERVREMLLLQLSGQQSSLRLRRTLPAKPSNRNPNAGGVLCSWRRVDWRRLHWCMLSVLHQGPGDESPQTLEIRPHHQRRSSMRRLPRHTPLSTITPSPAPRITKLPPGLTTKTPPKESFIEANSWCLYHRFWTGREVVD